MRKLKFIRTVIALMALVPLIIVNESCKKDQDPIIEDVTDYSKPDHWLVTPLNHDKAVDVFYLYPTAWTPDSLINPLYCEIDDTTMLAGSAAAYIRQATAFETAGNIYAPYYRQASSRRTLVLPEDQRWDILKNVPAKDVSAAFDYYIKNFNNGRPFIIAGHSQGANLMLFLLKDYMNENPDVYERMIAAYVIGYPVTADFMDANTHLKFAEGPDDTGVIISYNTQSPNIAPGTNIVVGNNIGLVINPINWKRDETLAPASESLGSYMPVSSMTNFEQVLNYADACIDLAQGVLICSSVSDSAIYQLSGGMLGIYHGFDFPFYYFNIRENAEKRVSNFLGK
jgi:hypothetical protein